jgi:hypothetical protein
LHSANSAAIGRSKWMLFKEFKADEFRLEGLTQSNKTHVLDLQYTNGQFPGHSLYIEHIKAQVGCSSINLKPMSFD